MTAARQQRKKKFLARLFVVGVMSDVISLALPWLMLRMLLGESWHSVTVWQLSIAGFGALAVAVAFFADPHTKFKWPQGPLQWLENLGGGVLLALIIGGPAVGMGVALLNGTWWIGEIVSVALFVGATVTLKALLSVTRPAPHPES